MIRGMLHRNGGSRAEGVFGGVDGVYVVLGSEMG